MKQELTYYQFCRKICEDFNIELNQKHETKFNQFPIKNGKRKINFPYDAIIVDKEGKQYPYMLNQTVRNEEKLIDFDYIYVVRPKTLDKILEETNLTLQTSKVKICEGGGWYSRGTRYRYKDFYCDI